MPQKGFRPTETRKSSHTGEMTVSEAGHKGGQKVRELIEKGEQLESKKIQRTG